MSNLRDLLQTENQEELKRRVCGTESTQWGNGWGNVLVDGYDMFYAGHCWQQPQMSSYRAWCGGFCVYPGVTTVQFHIWGGGGSGGGACCCQQGSPSGSGAYAMKTLCASDMGLDSLGGLCYLWCLGMPTDCMCTCSGRIGCKTYITGCGLTNFCAEGGMPGRTCCYIYYDQHGTNLTGTWGPAGDGCSAWNSSGCFTLDPCCCTSQLCQATDCACYYGADFGVEGRPGWFRVDCICGNTCFVRHGIPQPGGYRDRCVRYEISRNESNNTCNNRGRCSHGEWPGNQNCSMGLRGSGHPSPSSCGGTCYNAGPGNGGLIRITYR